MPKKKQCLAKKTAFCRSMRQHKQLREAQSQNSSSQYSVYLPSL